MQRLLEYKIEELKIRYILVWVKSFSILVAVAIKCIDFSCSSY